MSFVAGKITGNVLSQCDNSVTIEARKTRQRFPPVEMGGSHWAGAQRPKVKSQPLGASGEVEEQPTPHKNSANCGAAIPGRKNLDLKLRAQAKKLGLIPGSPRWRAYVLGTQSAMRKKKKAK